jgi:hypothetical protein
VGLVILRKVEWGVVLTDHPQEWDIVLIDPLLGLGEMEGYVE